MKQKIIFYLSLLSTMWLGGGQVMAQDPGAKPDDTRISISGTVDKVGSDGFTLDYGDGAIRVDMSDEGRDAGAYELGKGDKVTVHGVVDDDIYDQAAIDASGLYIEKIGTYFTSGNGDNDTVDPRNDVDNADTIIQGTVTSVGDEAFTLFTGSRTLRVEVDEMAFNPLTAGGYRNVREGDRVNITGNMENEFFEERVFDAQTVAIFDQAGNRNQGR